MFNDNTPSFTPTVMTERDEVELRAVCREIKEAIGVETFTQIVYEMCLPIEEVLRGTQPTDHPALRLIDQYRARQERGFE